jgi:hypothetical protein
MLAASARPRAAVTEHLQIVNVGNSPDDAILSGPITGHAIDVENRSHTMSVLKFSNGTITINHPTKQLLSLRPSRSPAGPPPWPRLRPGRWSWPMLLPGPERWAP